MVSASGELPPINKLSDSESFDSGCIFKRNLAHIEQLIDAGASLENLNKKQYKTRLVLTEVARQQQWLFDNHRQSIEDRIVSLSQPHIRPIVRGKGS
jgi:hypothetical protein